MPGAISARLAVASDLAQVQSIAAEAYAEYLPALGKPPLPVVEDYAPRIAANQVWMVERDGAVVGTATLEERPAYLFIYSLAVRPGAQGGGVGRWMLGLAERQARAAGLGEVRLVTHPLMTRNIRVYGEAGYRELGRTPNPHRPGWVLVEMARSVQ